MIKAIMVCEGHYEETLTFETQEECTAFANGFSAGVDKYGAGSAGVWTLSDLAHLHEKFDSKTIALIKEHLGDQH